MVPPLPIQRVVLVFLDGVGVGPADRAHNPFLSARMPWLSEALGRMPTLDEPAPAGEEAAVAPLDATLGIEGTPQSGTGQTALLTGRNAARRFGRHFGPWTPVALRPLLQAESLLRVALAAGLDTEFANAYPASWPGERSARRLAAPPLAAQSAGLLTRHHEDLARGDAVASEIVNTGWRTHLGHVSLPDPSPAQAGGNLARIARGARLTFFAHYSTDHAGHRGGMDGAVQALERVDAFLGGLLTALDSDTVVLVASDHGNIEDTRGGHTRNPALGLVVGPQARQRATELGSIMDVAGAVLRWLGVSPERHPGAAGAPAHGDARA
jgi:hypothetical protein